MRVIVPSGPTEGMFKHPYSQHPYSQLHLYVCMGPPQCMSSASIHT